jgi:hypothetical protein
MNLGEKFSWLDAGPLLWLLMGTYLHEALPVFQLLVTLVDTPLQR